MSVSAIKNARRQSKSPKPTTDVGYCLRETRECFGVPAGAPDATTAWENADHQHPTSNPSSIPRGVPVFWLGGSQGHGHVAIATGDGRCWSVDILRPGYWDRVPIADVAKRWPSLRLAGWTEDLNGVRVHTPKGERGSVASPGTPPGTFVWAVAVMFLGLIAACVALSIGLPESQNPAGLIAQMTLAFSALVGVLANLYKSTKIEQAVTDIGTDVAAVRNGEMEGKLGKVLDDRDAARERRLDPPTSLQA